MLLLCRARTAALLSLLFVIATPLAASAGRPRNVVTDGFVLAGQSNMLGESTQFENQRTGRVTSPQTNGLLSRTYRVVDNNWTLANEFPCSNSQCVGTACTPDSPNRTVEIHPVWQDVGAGTCVCSCGVHIP